MIVFHCRGKPLTSVVPSGADFFGFSHPTIQNLIQSCPGARKCSKWVTTFLFIYFFFCLTCHNLCCNYLHINVLMTKKDHFALTCALWIQMNSLLFFFSTVVTSGCVLRFVVLVMDRWLMVFLKMMHLWTLSPFSDCRAVRRVWAIRQNTAPQVRQLPQTTAHLCIPVLLHFVKSGDVLFIFSFSSAFSMLFKCYNFLIL